MHLASVNVTLKLKGTAPSVETALCFSLRQAFEVHDPVRFMLQEWTDSGCVALVAWCFYIFTDLIRLSIQYIPIRVSLMKSPNWVHGDICACVTAAHVYHPTPQALSTERKTLARVQLRKSHLDVAFVINNRGPWLPPFLFSLLALLLKSLRCCSQAPQTTSTLCLH